MTDDLQSFWTTIREDRSRGSSELTRRVLRRLKKYLSEPPTDPAETLPSILQTLRTIRPEMSLLVNSGYLLEGSLRKTESQAVPGVLREKIESLEKTLDESPQRMATHLDRIDLPLSRPLLFSRSGTVLDLIHHSGPEAVSVLESRPGEEGIGLADEFGEHVDVTFYYDMEALEAFKRADALLLGADSFREDGWFRNKTGTQLLARAAVDLPVLACFQTLKYEPSDDSGSVPSVESPTALRDDLSRSHPLFEWVPPDVVDWFVTEEDSVDNPEELAYQVEELRTLRDRNPRNA